MSGVSSTERLRALIRSVKDATGESYDDFARRSGLPKSTVHAIATKTERTDVPSGDTLRALAAGLQLPARVVIEAALQDAGLLEPADDDVPEAALLAEAMKDLAEGQRQRLVDVALELSRAFRDQQPPSAKVRRLRTAESRNAVVEAIENDPNLLPESKAHFLNQYQLLLRVQPTERLPYAAHGKRTTPVNPAEEARIEEVAKAAKEANPHSPKRKK
jgi:transcriptional regulator with XRE-family HTH domain